MESSVSHAREDENATNEVVKVKLTPELVRLLIPLFVLQLALAAAALRDLFQRPRVTGGNKLIWGIVILVFGLLGPLAYFVFGRKE